jgi:hypothetical protein
MRFVSLVLYFLLVSIFALVPGSGYGQSQAPAVTSQLSTTSVPPAPAQPQAAPLPKAKPAKVWDNDEIGTLRYSHGVSVVGNPSAKNVSAKSKAISQEKDPAWYRRQLAPLRADIDKLDAQIAKMQAFLKGENVSEQASLHPKIIPSPQDQLKQLEEKRAKDVETVNDLLDRARHNDIAPGDLR